MFGAEFFQNHRKFLIIFGKSSFKLAHMIIQLSLCLCKTDIKSSTVLIIIDN